MCVEGIPMPNVDHLRQKSFMNFVSSKPIRVCSCVPQSPVCISQWFYDTCTHGFCISRTALLVFLPFIQFICIEPISHRLQNRSFGLITFNTTSSPTGLVG